MALPVDEVSEACTMAARDASPRWPETALAPVRAAGLSWTRDHAPEFPSFPEAPVTDPAFLPVAALREDLLAWYRRRARDLPWRRRPSVYGIWVSEIMLQQTTVAAVIPYWERFLDRFPTVDALAAAPPEDVLAAWSGLGYYRRARHLHAAAREIVSRRDGRLPDSAAGWRELPGVGEYTAGAVASIGLNEAVPAVDGNVRRVLGRWLAASADEAAGMTPRELRDVAAVLVDPVHPGDWNQALMELGATMCRPAAPTCADCPVLPHCRAGLAGTADEVLPAIRRPGTLEIATSALAVTCAGHVLLTGSDVTPGIDVGELGEPVRRGLAGLHDGLLGLPGLPWYHRPERLDPQPFAAAWRRWLASVGVSGGGLTRVGRIRHAITRHRLEVAVFATDVPHDLRGAFDAALATGTRWPTLRAGREGLGHLAVSALAVKCLKRLPER